jgi:hypothetical protein
MYKITGRIILILLAASLVAGALYLLVNGVGGQPGLLSSLDRRGGPDGGFRNANRQAAPNGILAQGVSNLTFRPDFDGRGSRDRFSLGRGLMGVFSDLLAITLITALVVLVSGALKKALRRSPKRTT